MTPWTVACQLPCPRSPRVCSNSCPLCQWCYPTISSSIIPFSSCPQSFPASGSFPMSWLFVKGSHSIGASASASVLPMNIQVWFPLGLTNSNTIMLIINPKFLSWCIIRCNLVCLLRSFQSCFPLLISLFLSLLLLIFNYFNIIPSLLCLRKLWTMGISEHDDKTWKWREVSEIFG